MTATLRRRHSRIFAVLAPALPLLLIAGVAARRDEPEPSVFPAEASCAESSKRWEMEARAAMGPFDVRVRRSVDRPCIELQLLDHPRLPDLLVYWAMSKPEGDRLPSNAILLGSLGGVRVHYHRLPDEAAKTNGNLLLYSLAHRAVAGRLAMGDLP